LFLILFNFFIAELDLELDNRWATIQCVYGGLESENTSEDWEALEVCHLKKNRYF